MTGTRFYSSDCPLTERTLLSLMTRNSLMKKLLHVGIFLMCCINCNAESEFTRFLQLFPEKNWEELDSLTQVDWENYTLQHPITSKLANRNIWYDNENSPYTNHCRIKQNVKDAPNPDNAPFLRLPDGKLTTSRNVSIYRDGEEVPGYKNCQEPIAKVRLGDNHIMIVMLRKHGDPKISGYRTELEAYTFSLKDEQMISGFTLYAHPKEGAPVLNFFFNQDKSFTMYLPVEGKSDEANPASATADKRKGKIDEEGYLHYTYKYRNADDLFHARITVPDGHVDLREKPDSRSKILMTIPSGTKVVLEPVEGSNWHIVRQYETPNGFCKYRSGYINNNNNKFEHLRPYVYDIKGRAPERRK